MKKAIILGVVSAFLAGSCGKKKEEAKNEKTEKAGKPGETDKKPEEKPKMDNQARCNALVEKAFDSVAPHLVKIGVKIPPAQLKKMYLDYNQDTLKKCAGLNDQQLACVEKQRFPLTSRWACNLKSSLNLSMPAAVRKALRPKPVPYDEKTAKKLLKGFAGTWTFEDELAKRKTVYKVKKDGTATMQEFEGGKPKAKPVPVVFSFEKELRVSRKEGKDTRRGPFFRRDKKTAYMSYYSTDNLAKVPDKKNFKLRLRSGIVLRHGTYLLCEDGKCSVLDLSQLALLPAACKWQTDPKTKDEFLTTTFKTGQVPTTEKYYYVNGHLLHKFLYKQKFSRK